MMNKSEETFDEEQSLQVIRQMIDRAKHNLPGQAFIYILWGWVIFSASIAQFLLIQFSNFKTTAVVWTLLIVGFIGSAIKGRQLRKKEKAKTYIGTLMNVVWTAFIISYLILIAFSFKLGVLLSPVILVLLGGIVFIVSYVLKFRPLLWGSIIIWLAAIAAFLVPIGFIPLAVAGAMLFGFLVPGYILKNREEE